MRKLLTLLALTLGLLQAQQKREGSEYIVGPAIQPMVIYGEGWTQQFTLINVDYYQGGQPTSGNLKFYTRDGQPWKLPIKGKGSVDTIAIRLTSGQMVIFETEVSEAPQQLGWAVFEVNSSEYGIYHAYTTYRKQVAGRADLMASVPFVEDLEDEFVIPFDNRDGKYHGLGLVNNSLSAQSFTMKVYDTNGTLRRAITRQVCTRCLDWFSLTGDYPDLNGFAGQIRLTTPGFRTAPFTLLFAPNGAFMALPAVQTFGMN